MKLLKILLLVLGCAVFSADAMKRKEIEREESENVQPEMAAAPSTQLPAADWERTVPKKYKFDWEGLEKLPRDLRILLFIKIVEKSANLSEALKTIQSALRASKAFYWLINSDDVTMLLINLLANRFLHGNALRAADLLHTNASLHWSHTILPENIKENITRILDSADPDDPESTNKVIRAVKFYMNSSQSIKNVLHNEHVMIWLIRKVSKALNPLFMNNTDEYESATALAVMLYPEEPINTRVQSWLIYADKQLAHAAALHEALGKASTVMPDEINVAQQQLKSLLAAGIDITDDLSTQHSPLVDAKSPLILQTFIDAGANLNERTGGNGNTFLHNLTRSLYNATLHIQMPGEIWYGVPGNVPILPLPFEERSQMQYIRTAEVALKAGANPNITNDNDLTVLGLIEKYRNERRASQVFYFSEMEKLLREYGAR